MKVYEMPEGVSNDSITLLEPCSAGYRVVGFRPVWPSWEWQMFVELLTRMERFVQEIG